MEQVYFLQMVKVNAEKQKIHEQCCKNSLNVFWCV